MMAEKFRNQRQLRQERIEQISSAATWGALWFASVYFCAHILAASWR